MTEGRKSASAPTKIPVAVLVERRRVSRGGWSADQWEAVAVVAGKEVAGQECRVTVVHEDDDCTRYLWTGMKVELHEDVCENYWYNLMSDDPHLFVVCYQEEDESGVEELMPVLVTADQNEATGHMEIDDPVFSVQMPEQVHQWIERYVVENYVPAQKKKRKRRNWSEEADLGQATNPDPSRARSH
jgi:hypothetical protein